MKILSYNVRGLGGLEKRKEVRRLVSEKSPLCYVSKSQRCVLLMIFLLRPCGEIHRVRGC